MAGKKPALGSGLGALFADIETTVPAIGAVNAEAEPNISENAVVYVDIDEIKPNSMQPRQYFDPEATEELAASIERYGVIQPIILAKAEIGYELVAGERRWRAARKA